MLPSDQCTLSLSSGQRVLMAWDTMPLDGERESSVYLVSRVVPRDHVYTLQQCYRERQDTVPLGCHSQGHPQCAPLSCLITVHCCMDMLTRSMLSRTVDSMTECMSKHTMMPPPSSPAPRGDVEWRINGVLHCC